MLGLVIWMSKLTGRKVIVLVLVVDIWLSLRAISARLVTIDWGGYRLGYNLVWNLEKQFWGGVLL